jgi:hypothetical protein
MATISLDLYFSSGFLLLCYTSDQREILKITDSGNAKRCWIFSWAMTLKISARRRCNTSWIRWNKIVLKKHEITFLDFLVVIYQFWNEIFLAKVKSDRYYVDNYLMVK